MSLHLSETRRSKRYVEPCVGYLRIVLTQLQCHDATDVPAVKFNFIAISGLQEIAKDADPRGGQRHIDDYGGHALW